MEIRFHHDFSHVRVHTDRQAAESARSINAVAYTAGKHVVLPQPVPAENSSGLRVVAHELAHVAQQAGTTVTGSLHLDARGESEADAAGKTEGVGAQATPATDAGIRRQVQNFAQTRASVLEELKHPMPVALYGLLDSLDTESRQKLRDDFEVSSAIRKLPEGVRLTIGRHLWFGHIVPSEVRALENAAAIHDLAKVRQGLAVLKQDREGKLGESLEIGNLKERLDYEFRGTRDAAAVHQEAEAALEFDWSAMHDFAMRSPRFRALEASVLRRNPGLRPGKGTATESNVAANYLSVERNLSVKGAVVRYAHELANFSLADQFDRVRGDAQAGRFATPHDCALARIDVELEANVIREQIAQQLGFEFDRTLASGLRQVAQAPSEKQRKQASDAVWQDLRKRAANPTTEHGRKVMPLYENICAGWMGQKQNP
jgi:hypothetical protein